MAYRPYDVHGIGNRDIAQGSNAQRGQRKGAPFAVFARQQEWERCVVRNVDPDAYTCDVFTQAGRYLSSVNWPGNEREIMAPKIGDRFGVHYSTGSPQLVEITTSPPRFSQESAFRVTAVQGVGGEDPVNAGKGRTNLRGEQPRDVIPGDWIRMGDLGNLVGVLAGGTTVVKAGELAQVIATQAQNLVRVVGQNMQLYTGAGTLECSSKDGKTSLTMRIGADAATESTPAEENFRIRCDLGDDGELVDFRVTDGQGRDLYRQHVDPDGRVQKVATRETAVYDEDLKVIAGTNHELRVGGNATERVAGSSTEQVGGSRVTQVGGANRMVSGGDAALVSMHDTRVAAARFLDVTAGGSLTSTDPAMRVTVNNGDAKFVVGSPVAGDPQVSGGKFVVETYRGDIKMTSLFAKISLNSPLPGGVKVGGPGLGVQSALLYEAFEAFMNTFGTLLDTHTHLQPALGGAPTSMPVVPPWTASRGLFVLARSNFVKFGG